MKEDYVYPARINRDGNVWRIEFLDFPNMIPAEGADREEAVRSAQNLLALEILDRESRKEALPAPDENETEKGTDIIYIHIWLPYFRKAVKEIYVKKNVTIPQWLDIMARENNVSYSAALVKGIKLALGIEH